MSRTDEPLGLTTVRKMKVLVVVFGNVSCEEQNWQSKLKKMEKSLDSYHSQVRFSLSLHTLGLGELVYLANVLIIPDWVLR